MHELPGYMKIYFLALNTFVNEVAFDILKEENGHNIIPHLRKAVSFDFHRFLGLYFLLYKYKVVIHEIS